MYTHVVCKVTRYFLFLEAWYICGHIWLYVVHICHVFLQTNSLFIGCTLYRLPDLIILYYT